MLDNLSCVLVTGRLAMEKTKVVLDKEPLCGKLVQSLK